MAGTEQSVKLYRIRVRYRKRALSRQAPTEFYILVENENQLDEALNRYANVAQRLTPELVAATARAMPPSLAVFIDMRVAAQSDE